MSTWEKEVGFSEAVRRVLLAAISPFSTFSDIALRPDSLGPLLCLLLLTLVYSAYNHVLIARVELSVASGSPLIPPKVVVTESVVRITAVNATGRVRDLGPLSEEYYAEAQMLSLGYGITAWLGLTVAIWLSLKVLGGSTRLFTVLAGYTLSVKLYEYFTRLILVLTLTSWIKRVELLIWRGASITLILSQVSQALAQTSGLRTVMRAHMVFFTVWGVIVVMAAAQEGGFLSTRRAVVAGIIGYLLASLLQMIAYTVLTMGF